ncbi:MAG: sugar phosphate nucleotidyltransferase [Chloroflexota bacterium]
MQVIILCGGAGTRISGGDRTVKKEMVEIGERPILWHIMKIFAAYGHQDFVLPLGYRGDLIRRYFLDYEMMNRDLSFTLGQPSEPAFHDMNHESDWRITLIDTGLEANKGARIKQVQPHINTSPFFVTYGDGVGDVNLDHLLDFHRQHGRLATVTGVQPNYQYGIMTLAEGDRVTGYEQYPRLGHWINAGFMLFEQTVFDYLTGDNRIDLESGALARLAADGQLMMYPHRGFWQSMDTFKDALTLNELWDSGKAPWKVWP